MKAPVSKFALHSQTYMVTQLTIIVQQFVAIANLLIQPTDCVRQVVFLFTNTTTDA